MEANSTPTAPAPTITSDFGISFRLRISMFVSTAIVWLQTGQHARFGAGREDDILRLHLAGLAVIRHFHGQHAVLCRAGQLAVASDRFHLVLLHQEIEALGVLGHDFRLCDPGWRPS